ncbi:hypothetical protein BJY00DRAFT_313151 [Aspergillus carlsbadensis]|nr:hypothetical protein BJY00DRAFT_313151 [Aspergillus carlsbadensis]
MYNPAIGQYVAPTTAAGPGPRQAIPPRPRPQPAETMSFWSEVFPQAMRRLRATDDEPAGRLSTGCGIRQVTDWAGIRRQLEKAQGSYDLPRRDSRHGNAKGLFTRLYRKSADATDRWKLGTKVAVHVDYISPVVALVDILLDAAAVASDVRNRACTVFKPEEMEEDFEIIEVSVGLYLGDLNIQNAAVDLVHGIFRAMEEAIGFFLSKRASRVQDALAQAGGYQKELINRLEDMQKRSAKLVRQVELADKHSSRVGIEKIIAVADAGFQKFDEVRRAQQLHADEVCTRMLNQIDRVFRDGEERAKQRVREVEARAERRCQEMKQHFQDELRKMTTVRPSHNPGPSPHPPPQVSSGGFPYVPPPPQVSQFAHMSSMWLWQPSAQQYYAYTPPPTSSSTSISHFPLGILNAPRYERSDVQHILSQRSIMFPASVRRSETALLTCEFRRWLTHPSSQSLLIEGDQESHGAAISAVSLVSALVYLSTKDRKGHVPLLWCCSLHCDDGDEDGDYKDEDEDGSRDGEESHLETAPSQKAHGYNTGPQAMIAAIVAQLLRQDPVDFSSMLCDQSW